MAFPTIAFNSSGSDTTASGDNTAVNANGTLAATHANTTVNITDAVALGSVPLDGSACLWIISSSGRRWSKITNITGSSGAWVVTVGDAYANTESGKSWAIGGKRATLDNATQLGLDVRGGWTIDIQTDQTITVNFNLRPNAVAGSPFTITSTVGTRATKIQTSTNSKNGLDVQACNNIVISNLYLLCTAGTPGDGIGQAGTAGATTNILITNCLIDGWLNGIRMSDSGTNNRFQSFILQGTEIKNCTQNAIWNSISGPPTITGCHIHDNGSASSGSTVYPAIGQGSATGFFGCGLFVRRTVFANNYGPALNGALADPSGSNASINEISFSDCVFYKNNRLGGATAGIMGDIRLSPSGSSPLHVEDCTFYGSAAGNFAFQLASGSLTIFLGINNAFGVYTVNFSGTGLSSGTGAVALTGDPFTSSTDYALNATAGAGAACKGAGLQGIPNATASSAQPDIGAIQSAAPAGAVCKLAGAGGLAA